MAGTAAPSVSSSPPATVPIDTGIDMSGVWMGIAGLLVLVIIGAVLIHMVRQHFSPTHAPGDDGFSLHDLRQLRDTGKLSDDEYDHLRGLLVGTSSTKHMHDDDHDQNDVRKHE